MKFGKSTDVRVLVNTLLPGEEVDIVRIAADEEGQQIFSDEGDRVRMDADGKASLNLRFACKSCHGGQSDAWLLANAQNFHDQSFAISAGMSGTWWAGPERDGEGWLLDASANTFVAAMYTYDASGRQAWLIGSGSPEGDMVTLAVQVTEGPSFGADYDPAALSRSDWGTANFLFVSCSEATVELLPNPAMQQRGFEALTVNLVRLTAAAISCS